MVPDDRARSAGHDPGLHGGEPSEDELDQEDRLRSQMSVAQLMDEDLDDPETPSGRTDSGDPTPDSFDVPLREFRGPSDAG